MDEPIINHAEAWDLAHMRRERSNLARCYIDLRKAVSDGLNGHPGAKQKLAQIDATSADSLTQVAADR